jgi:hypothetical protein
LAAGCTRDARPILHRLQHAEAGDVDQGGAVRIDQAEGAGGARRAGRLRQIDGHAPSVGHGAARGEPPRRGDAVHRPARHMRGSREHSTAALARRFAVAERDRAVDDDVADAFRQLRRILVGRAIDHGIRIEDRDIGGHSRRDEPAIDHPDRVRRQRRHLADRILPGEHALLANIASEDARKAAPGAWMLPGVQRRPAVAGNRRRRVLQDPDEILFRSEPHDPGLVALLEDAHDRLARRHLLLAGDVDELALDRRQVDAARAAEARVHCRLGLLDDAGALRRIVKSGQHRLAAAVLRPRGDSQCAEPCLAGEIRVDVGGGVCPALRRGVHHRQQLAGPTLFAALRLHVRDDRHETGLAADGDRLGHADLRAEVRLRRQAIVVREIGPPRDRWFDDADDLFHLRVIRRLVVEARGHAPGPVLEARDDQPPHRRDIGVGRAAIRRSDDRGPDAVEADVGADVDRQPGARGIGELLGDVGEAAAIGVDDFGGDPLCEHVLGGRQRIGGRVAVDVDEPGRNVEAARVDVDRRPLVFEIGDADDEAVRDRHVGRVTCDAGAVDDGAVANDYIVGSLPDEDAEVNRGRKDERQNADRANCRSLHSLQTSASVRAGGRAPSISVKS